MDQQIKKSLSYTNREKIEKATNKSLSTENWKLIMEICELINSIENGSKDALKAIKKH